MTDNGWRMTDNGEWQTMVNDRQWWVTNNGEWENMGNDI